MKTFKFVFLVLAYLFIFSMVGCSKWSSLRESQSVDSVGVRSSSTSENQSVGSVVLISSSVVSQGVESVVSSPEPSYLHIDFATDERVSKYSSVNEFIEFKEPGYQKIILTTDRKVTNFKFIEIGYTEENYHYKYYEKSVLYSTSEFSPEKPFVVTWMEWGDIIKYRGISFVDENNITKNYYLCQSGKDGSLHLIEF